MPDDVVEQTEAPKQEAQEKVETYTREQVEQFVSSREAQIVESIKSEIDTRISEVLSTPEGQKRFADTYGLKLADVKAAVEEDIDPIEKKFKEIEARQAEIDKKLSGHDKGLTEASVELASAKIFNEYNERWDRFRDEMPEISDPVIWDAIREDVFSAMDADPRLGDPENIAKLGRIWIERQQKIAPAFSRAFSTSARSRGVGGGAVPGSKDPSDMTAEEARSAVLSLISR